VARPNFNIGIKLGIPGGIGILLVIGLVAYQIFSNGLLAYEADFLERNHLNKQDATAAAAAVQRNYAAARDLAFAWPVEQLDKILDEVRAGTAEATAHFDSALQRAVQTFSKANYNNLKVQVAAYLTAAGDLVAARKASLNALTQSDAAGAGLAKAIEALLSSPALARLPDRREVEIDLHRANAALVAAQAAAWRFVLTGEAAQKDRALQGIDKTLEALKGARARFAEKEGLAEIDNLLAMAARAKSSTEEIIKLEEAKTRIGRERLQPIAADINKTLADAMSVAERFLELHRTNFDAQKRWAERLGLAIGLPVVLVLIGLALFPMFAVARPIAAMTAAMQNLASGNFDVVLPGLDRGDEIGGMAHAVEMFKVKAIEHARAEAEEKEVEARAHAAKRKADLQKFASTFETEVAGIVDTVSSASTQLAGAATTLTDTADSTQQLSGMVAAASEVASANVQSVAAATDELSASVNEISRQVQESSRIAGEAVQQAQTTDARINELSKAASRIGDVVKLITTVAEQTNLLALNATIEAARAGEAGRGFAVVAAEVKTLANQTAKATDEISMQITGMQSATQHSVIAIKEIRTTIERISEIAGAIAAAVVQQGAATAEISRNVAEAAKGTSNVAANIGDVNREASQTGKASGQVLASAQQLSSQGTKLKSEVAKFLATVRSA
jgi:methyl-accepting chemotaxis protein